MINKGLPPQIATSNGLQYHQQDKKKAKQCNNIETELQFEIECPRCYDTMTLCSDFDCVYYFCEECNFYLYIQNK
jgi:hypothetical protein